MLPELTVHARDRDESEVTVPTRRRTRVAETRVAVAAVPERVMLTLGGFCACVVIETEVDELRVSALTVSVKSHDADGESVPAGIVTIAIVGDQEPPSPSQQLSPAAGLMHAHA